MLAHKYRADPTHHPSRLRTEQKPCWTCQQQLLPGQTQRAQAAQRWCCDHPAPVIHPARKTSLLWNEPARCELPVVAGAVQRPCYELCPRTALVPHQARSPAAVAVHLLVAAEVLLEMEQAARGEHWRPRHHARPRCRRHRVAAAVCCPRPTRSNQQAPAPVPAAARCLRLGVHPTSSGRYAAEGHRLRWLFLAEAAPGGPPARVRVCVMLPAGCPTRQSAAEAEVELPHSTVRRCLPLQGRGWTSRTVL